MSATAATRAPDRPGVVDRALLEHALAGSDSPVQPFRDVLAAAHQSLAERFRANESVETLVRFRARVIDQVVQAVWEHFAAELNDRCALVAVGGYGRGELHPHSDIDLMVVRDKTGDAVVDEAISRFFTFLWDIGLEVGHAVRTPGDCEVESRNDVTVMTTMMEARLLTGSAILFSALEQHIGQDRVWDSAAFFHAKCAEQEARHHAFDDTGYNLEPNIKASPGGLRDIQTIVWIARRHLGSRSLNELHSRGFLTPGQLRILRTGRAFLWRIRFALHLLVGRREDRLLFDHQMKLAKALGYEDATYTLGVEQLMQRYYRTVMELSRLNEMLLQLFEDAIIVDERIPVQPMGKGFQARNGYLEVIDEEIFVQDPSILLEIFLLLERNIDLRGVNARTIALIKQHLYLIDEEFRQNPRNHRLFLDILREPQGVTRTLKRMNTYGVLGLYIPAFGRIVGRMQYDLFHVYTVDAHTLFVVENLRRFALPRFNDEFPSCSRIMQSLEKPEIAYLAGLFHDIAKGRGGDHSVLGAVDAEAFCLEHGMSRYDARLLAWLVRNHLLLSMTAQKKDLNDPGVVNAFARAVGDNTHLNYLYLLTVADVRGTNPKIWNSWKDTLFRELYLLAKRALRRGFARPIDAEELIDETQGQARDLLDGMGLGSPDWKPVWKNFTDEYFLRHRPEEIAWHTRVLAESGPDQPVVVDVSNQVSEGLTAIMVYAPKRMRSFVRITAALDELGLTIVDARIVPMSGRQTLDTYCVLESDGSRIREPRRMQEIRGRLPRALTASDDRPLKVHRRAPRQVRMFSTAVQVSVSQDPVNNRTVLELVAADRPGLLLQVGKILEEQRVALHNAKIATLGERAEDVFFITTLNNRRLDESRCDRLVEAIQSTLSSSPAH